MREVFLNSFAVISFLRIFLISSIKFFSSKQKREREKERED